MPRAVRVAGDGSLRIGEAGQEELRMGEVFPPRGDRGCAHKLGLAADPRDSASRGLVGQPQVHGATVSPGRLESQPKSPAPLEGRGDSRGLERTDAPGRAVEHGLHARPVARGSTTGAGGFAC